MGGRPKPPRDAAWTNSWKLAFCAARVLAKKPLCPQGPVVRWHAGLSEPEFGPIAQFLKTRFTTEPRSTMVVVSTERAARLTGGRAGRIPRRSEATHDLSLASVFLRMRRTSPARARTWIYETRLMIGRSTPGTKLPDAMVTETDRTSTVIELGGEYPKAKLVAFHKDCARAVVTTRSGNGRQRSPPRNLASRRTVRNHTPPSA